ncbi:MAG: SprT-like domain-containing protein [Acidobacteriota bacterium]
MANDLQLSVELEAALVRELARCYERTNWIHFGERLTAPVIVLADSPQRLGQWARATRTLELQRRLVLDRPWPEVLAVLEHEMAHQYVDEVLQVRDETAHGATFQRVCEERGIDARASGAPAARGEAGDKMLERIRKLFALAASSNQHEAEAAMKRAHELMLRHNLEQLPVRHEFEVRHVGEPRRRADPIEAEIVGLLTELFFVEAISIPVYVPRTGLHGRVYEIAGTLANVEMASHVHAFLLATADRLWRENRGDARVKSGRDRVPYQTGVIRGFRDKLLRERVVLRGEGLVWVGDRRLEEFYRRRHPRVVTRRRSMRTSAAHHAGREAGRNVVLHRPVTAGGAGGPKLLTGR